MQCVIYTNIKKIIDSEKAVGKPQSHALGGAFTEYKFFSLGFWEE